MARFKQAQASSQIMLTESTEDESEPSAWLLEEDEVITPADSTDNPLKVHFQETNYRNCEFDNDQPTKYIVLHSKELNITQYAAFLIGDHSSEAETVKINKLTECRPLEQIALGFDKILPEKSIIKLEFSFSGAISLTFSGLYRSAYHSPEGKAEYSIVTQFEPTDARRLFPCFDEPAMKAVFKMSIVRQPQHLSLANMNLVSTEDYAHSLKVDHFKESVKMSTYLVALSVNNFAKVTNKTSSGTEVSVFSPKSQIQSAHYALQTAIAALQYFESFFKIKFPLPKQDLLAFSDFAAGAMENWGLVTFRDYLLLFQEGRTTTATEEFQAMVVVHELAHQWFGNLVTMRWWNDLWLNEGFATLMESFATDKIYPDWKLMDDYYLDITAKSMVLDGLNSTHPISTEVNDPAQIGSIFDAVSYEKGGSILHMIMDLAGIESFQAGLQEYLTFFQYSNAEGKDLWKVIEQHVHLTGVGIEELAESWTHLVGYPLITVQLNSNKESITIKQNRFLYLEEQRNYSLGESQTWLIPLSYRTKSSASTVHWITDLNQNSISIPESEWIIFNGNGTGYYRILHDENMYKALTNELDKNCTILSAMERNVLINDMFSMLKAGYINVDTVFNLINYFKDGKEQNVMPLKVLMLHLESVEILLRTTDLHERFREYFKWLIMPYYEKYGWDLVSDHQTRKLQVLVSRVACHLKIADCISKAKDMFGEWLKDPLKVPADHRLLVISIGIEHGNASDWDTVFHQFKRSNLPSEQETYIHSLASTTNALQLNRYLSLSLDPSIIKPNLISSVVAAVSFRVQGQLLAWKFVRSHWSQLQDILGKTTMLGRCMSDTVSEFTTEFDLKEVISFFKDKDLGLNVKRYEQAQEKIKLNIQWLNLNKDNLNKWLEKWEVLHATPKT